MRPGQIRVFNGLRVTTEHVDHFQASLHSAIQDIREILGLGMVHAGFEVSAVDAQTITVQPGLAFDLLKNRVVSDEPKTLSISFEQKQNPAFLCVKYDQIQGGETEGRSTLIWDGCSLVVRPTLPTGSENLLVLARLTRTADGNLGIVDLRRGEPPQQPVTDRVSDAPSGRPPTLMVRQGVLRMTSSPSERYPGTSAAEAVRSTPGGIVGSGHDLGVTVARATLPVDFSVTSLSCHVLTSVQMSFSKDEPMTTHSVATGEATFSATGVAQFGLSANGNSIEELTDDALARTLLGTAQKKLTLDASHTDAEQLLTHLALVTRIERLDSDIGIVCNLVWTGITTDELLRRLDALDCRLQWSNQVAWKAIGQV